ncbi:DNA polymerase I [Sporosarcina globispora]|uniref:DNA polymerase I n=1 Tax=Sporosarcina globispora TaxID=1459 RepID=A0A0M0GCK5_SPOGL|nr:DNA polymerase [Sporosarcina globispora]KON87463.1 DNA polymerase I [Sporosarcina globispora]
MLIQPKLETEVTKKYEKHWTDNFDDIERLFIKDTPKLGVFDAETTGLHIKKDKPFMWVFGWLLPKEKQTNELKGRVFAFEHDLVLLVKIINLSKEIKMLVGHNVKYDLHMLINGGVDEEIVYDLKNISDTMGICRMSFDAVSARDGGDMLGLKKVSEKYIDPRAAEFEKEVKKELKRINDAKRVVLKDLLKPYKDIGWGLGKIKEAYKVKKRNEMDMFTKERKQRWLEIPKEIENLYFNWLEEHPFADYSEVDRNIMMEYVHGDGIYTLELVEKFYPTVLQRKQKELFEKENKLIIELLKMERVGMTVNMDYLKECFEKCDNEIQKLYEELWNIVGEFFTVSQEKVIADYFEKLLGERPSSTDKSFLKKHKEDRVSQLITRLRRLEKWQSTYISRIIEVAEYDGNFYTQYGQFNTVSGRLGSDAQQFPKERILSEEGEKYEKEHGEGKAPVEMEIFSPRRAFIPRGGKYGKIAYFDLSQIELRAQANYTMLLGRPDLNLCRAYMPYKCKHYKTGEEYKYDTKIERMRWIEKKDDGTSVWLMEDGSPWVPTDVHSETSHNTLIALAYKCAEKYKEYFHDTESPVDEKSFKKFWRYIGKMFNFMRNYGGGAKKASEALEVSMEIANALVSGWSSTFPEVAYYQKMVGSKVQKANHATNMYGRVYYLSNTEKAYKVGNYLVQGSCADMLKDYVVRIGEWLKQNKCKTLFLANIHDELQFLVYEGEEWIFPYIKQIMEDVDWMKVPVVVDLEITETTWADKKEVHIELPA